MRSASVSKPVLRPFPRWVTWCGIPSSTARDSTHPAEACPSPFTTDALKIRIECTDLFRVVPRQKTGPQRIQIKNGEGAYGRDSCARSVGELDKNDVGVFPNAIEDDLLSIWIDVEAH